MPITLFKKVTVHIDTTKYSKDEKTKEEPAPKNISANIIAQAQRADRSVRKYSRSSNNRRRNG